MSMALMVVMVSCIHTYPQTPQAIYVKCVQIYTCQSCSNKVIRKKVIGNQVKEQGG